MGHCQAGLPARAAPAGRLRGRGSTPDGGHEAAGAGQRHLGAGNAERQAVAGAPGAAILISNVYLHFS